MKRLFVLRHAKSSWDHSGLIDFERPLNKRGKKAAPLMGKLMLEKDLKTEFILSSPAERAMRTAILIARHAHFELEPFFDERIYGANTNLLMHIVSEFDAGMQSAMIIGHNPGFEGLVEILTGKYERMPTAALAVVDLDIEDWKAIGVNCGKLFEILRPKEQTVQ